MPPIALDYHSHSLPTILAPSPLRRLVLALATIALVPAYLVYSHEVAYYLWSCSGGIRRHGIWTAYGTSQFAWTNPINLPTGFLCAADLGVLAILCQVAAALMAAFSLADLLVRFSWRVRPLFGPWHWRLWLFLACWAWIPFPAKFTWLYYWTVAY